MANGRVVRERRAMLAGMAPVLGDGVFVFCTTVDAGVAAAHAVARIEEAEGTTLVLDVAAARRLEFDVSMPMRRITLEVFSALDGVGLTAAVAGALAAADIPCNIVAGFHHDHLFVPAAMAEAALAVLRDLQAGAA